MKKLISLALAALLCLCMLVPACAQTSLPFRVFQKNFNAVYQSQVGGAQVLWHTATMDGQTVMVPMADDMTMLAMVTLDGMNVRQIVITHNGPADSNEAMAFVIKAALTGAALTRGDYATPTDAFGGCILQGNDAMMAFMQGRTGSFAMWGAACMIQIAPHGDGTYDYMLIIIPQAISQ